MSIPHGAHGTVEDEGSRVAAMRGNDGTVWFRRGWEWVRSDEFPGHRGRVESFRLTGQPLPEDEPETMGLFYVTFGRAGLRNGYVLVRAWSEESVRAWAANEYGRCWSGVYDEGEWHEVSQSDRERFWPLGCFGEETLHYSVPLN